MVFSTRFDSGTSFFFIWFSVCFFFSLATFILCDRKIDCDGADNDAIDYELLTILNSNEKKNTKNNKCKRKQESKEIVCKHTK